MSAQGMGPIQAAKEATDYADNQAAGEQGSNVIYLGVGTAGMVDSFGNNATGQGLIMSIYTKNVFTIAAYQNYIMGGYDNTVSAVKQWSTTQIAPQTFQ